MSPLGGFGSLQKSKKMNSILPNNSQAPQSEAMILQVGATLICALTNRGHAKIKYSNHQYNEPQKSLIPPNIANPEQDIRYLIRLEMSVTR
jgi:hypothetical protein